MSERPHQGKGGSADQQKKPGTAAPRTSTGSIPAQLGPQPDRVADLRTDASMLTATQKNMLGSQFADASAERRRNSLLATSMPSNLGGGPPGADEPTSVGQKFDGKTVQIGRAHV
jgi:hypothetical protein